MVGRRVCCRGCKRVRLCMCRGTGAVPDFKDNLLESCPALMCLLGR